MRAAIVAAVIVALFKFQPLFSDFMSANFNAVGQIISVIVFYIPIILGPLDLIKRFKQLLSTDSSIQSQGKYDTRNVDDHAKKLKSARNTMVFAAFLQAGFVLLIISTSSPFDTLTVLSLIPGIGQIFMLILPAAFIYSIYRYVRIRFGTKLSILDSQIFHF